jgi:osmoprotectant transport system ATP-binding protein
MIELRKLVKAYGDAVVVDSLSLTVAAGELVVLLGESGSGKTTALKMINRLVEPTSGEVWLNAMNTAQLEPHLLRRRVGYVFQKVGLFPHMTVSENVGVTPVLLGWDQGRIRGRVEELLVTVELDPAVFGERFPHELSGGQQQRVGVARALAAGPDILLLDEPFGALDPLTRDKLQQSFAQIRRRQQLTAIFVTHDMIEALALADRIAVMRHGRLVQIGPPRELLTAPADDYVAQLMGTPRRQAELIDGLLAGGGS